MKKLTLFSICLIVCSILLLLRDNKIIQTKIHEPINILNFKKQLGKIVATNDTINHTFRIKNTSQRPISVINTFAAEPCCSFIAKNPPRALPGSILEIPVGVKTQNRTGLHTAKFIVETDSAEFSRLTLTLTMELLPSIEISEDSSNPKIYLRQQSNVRYFLTTRTITDGENTLPQVSLEAGEAKIVLNKKEGSVNFRFQAYEYTIELKLPAILKVGAHRRNLQLRWNDGRLTTIPLIIQVYPHITANPGAIVLTDRHHATTKHVIVNSSSSKFLIRRVTGPSLKSYHHDASKAEHRHNVIIDLDPSAANVTSSHVIFETDHPLQPQVTVSVIIPN